MFEVSSVAGSKLDAAAAIRQSAVRPHYSVKNQMMRLLRRSKSAAQTPAEKIQPRQNGHHYHHNQNNHQNIRNGGMVVNIVEGLPFVVGAKNKKVKRNFHH
ncbi:hypothetical protein BDFB_009615 [Asbolus verrucosus]|uniref:Uncharacterized protein n=1 Tax=Asbolus verrucosus TaxID=1661398 RepID=A0A482W5M1_ASBVE|nr:hypothetical protein BDFB_009615 [Asbolus verrucosus]